MLRTKIGKGALIWGGVVSIAITLYSPAFGFYFSFIPIILGVIALTQKDKYGLYGLLLGILSFWYV